MVKTPQQHAWPRGGITCEQEAGRVFLGDAGFQARRPGFILAVAPPAVRGLHTWASVALCVP